MNLNVQCPKARFREISFPILKERNSGHWEKTNNLRSLFDFEEFIKNISKMRKETILIDSGKLSRSKDLEKIKWELSDKAKNIIQILSQASESPDKGKIAAIDPESGDYFIANTTVDAFKKGREKQKGKKGFYFVRIGYPYVDEVKSIKFEGSIVDKRYPKTFGEIINKRINLNYPNAIGGKRIELIPDTGFTAYLSLDTNQIDDVENYFMGKKPFNFAGENQKECEIFLSTICVGNLSYDIEIVKIKGKPLMGMSLMQQICKRAVFDFENDKVLFED